MTPLLIYKDTAKIKLATAFFNQSVDFVQQLYLKFKANKVDVTFMQLSEIIENLQSERNVSDRWLAGYLCLNNAADLQAAIKQFIAVKMPKTLDMFRIETNLMQQDADKITANINALKIIESRFCFYAQNDSSGELIKHLTSLCSSLNIFYDYMHKNNMPFKKLGLEPDGVEFINATYRPDISFIRDLERAEEVRRKGPRNKRTIKDAA